MNVARNPGLVIWILVLSLYASATARQKMLWQGVVKPEAINVYQSASTSEHVTATLKQGDVVDVVLQVSISGSEWCRVSRAGTSEPIGFVLCLNLERAGSGPGQIARAQQAASQSRPLETVPAPPAATSVPAPDQQDVLDLHEAGLPEQVLIAKIKSSQSNFDTSPSQLKQLKAAGVADAVILAMVQAPVGQPQAPSTSTDTPPAENAKPIPSTVAVLSAPKQPSEQGDSGILNKSVLSPKEKYPLHVRVIVSGVSFVYDNPFTSMSECWHLFNTSVCATQGSGPQTYGIAMMRVKVEETGEEADVECGGRRLPGAYCKALPPGLYAARFFSYPMNRQRVALVIPALPLEGKNKDKEVAAYFTKDLHHPYTLLPEFDPVRK